MKSVRSRNFIHVTASVVIDILPRHDGGLQGVLVPQAMEPSERIDLLLMDCIHDLTSKEFRFPDRIHLARRRNRPLCSSDVLRMSFFAFSRDIARGLGVLVAAPCESSCSGVVAIVLLSFAMNASSSIIM